ncbi:MAG: glycosyltransferase [Oscillospiraceae bacterium]|nr:glycosyltransferase [Oscillospiraceae bacterium]
MAQVSVVIPIYNIQRHLRQCLDSIAGQTLTDLEILCVDDGSTDESPEILAEYARKDSRFQIITQPNGGPGTARNTGMARATGKYLIFLDSDDWFEPDFLAQMVARAQETGADVTICRAVEFDTGTGKELPSEWMLKSGYLPGEVFSPEEIREHIFQFTYGWPWDKLYRTDFVKSAGLCYPPLPNSEDLVFVFQSLALAERISVVSRPLVHHRVNRMDSVSNSRHCDPEVPYEALALLRQGLEKRNVYSRYERSFLNWAMEFLVWNVANMGEKTAQRKYFDQLKRVWLPAMEFDAHSRSYYENSFTYQKYRLAKYAPWPVFSGVLRTYKRWKGRAERGNSR